MIDGKYLGNCKTLTKGIDAVIKENPEITTFVAYHLKDM